MNQEQRSHFAAEKLFKHWPQAKKIVEEGFESNETYSNIVSAVKDATGEKLSLSSLQRYYTRRWLPAHQRQEEVSAKASASAKVEWEKTHPAKD